MDRTPRTLAALAATLALATFSCRSPEPVETSGSSAGGPELAAFPPEAVDHLEMAVTVEVEIFAIGKGTVELTGSVAVHRSGPQPPDGKAMVGDLIGASLRGRSKVFGEVVAVESPIAHSPCRYELTAPGQYRGHFDIHGWFWLPEHDLLVYDAEPVRVEGTSTSIPPVGEKATTVEREIALRDLRHPRGNPIGVLTKARGEIRRLVPIAEHLAAADTSVEALVK